MIKFYILLGVLLIIGVIAKAASNRSSSENNLPYKKKIGLPTPKEQGLFRLLQAIYTDQYYVFPQIHIMSDKIIKFNNTFQPKFILVDREDINEKTDAYRTLSQFLTNKLGFIQGWQDGFLSSIRNTHKF